MNISSLKITGIASSVFLLIALSIYLFNSSSEKVFPKVDDVNYVYGTYHEDIENDWSVVELDSVDHPFKMSYSLSRATRNPFVAGFIAKKSQVATLANFKDHNAFRINLNSKIGMRIPIMLTLDYPEGMKKKNGIDFPMVTIMKYIDYQQAGDYIVKFDEMMIPDWWFRVHRLHRDEVDLNKVVSVQGIVIGSCSILRENLDDSIEINSIEFFTDHTVLYRRIALITGILLLISMLIKELFVTKQKNKVT